MRQIFKFAFFMVAIVLATSIATAQKPQVLLLDADQLALIKKNIKANKYQHAFKDLKDEADKLLTMEPVSVMDKAFTPASGNKHDYMSQAPYFWYDSSKPNGVPYMRKDGERNPEILKITDRKNIGALNDATSTLSVAYYLTGNEKYAKKTVELLKHWFINEASKMNPNLDFGQGIPGVNTGRGIGIIETIALTGIADAVGLLKGSSSLSSNEEKALKQWYTEYLNWMQTSKNGKEEHEAKNNHGSYYDMQVVDFALFTGNREMALKTLKESKERMELQIDKEGKMPLELERTQSLWYSTYNLEAWFKLAKLSEVAGIDLWNHTTKDGGSIRKALDWLAPFATNGKPWPYEQIEEYKKENIYILFSKAAKTFKDKKYKSLASKLNVKLKDPVDALLYGVE